jgi:hypothetical protein
MKTSAVLLLGILFAVIGCSQRSLEGLGGGTKGAPAMAKVQTEVARDAAGVGPPVDFVRKQDIAAGAQAPDAKPAMRRRIKFTADIHLIADDFAKAKSQLYKTVDDHEEAYIAKSDVAESPGQPRKGTWTLRVPVAQFKKFCDEVLTIGEVEKNSSDSEDLSEAYYDLESHIKNRRAELEALRKLQERATDMPSLTQFRKEIADLEDYLNRKQGEFNRLTKITDMTTVTVVIKERQKYSQDKPPAAAETPEFGTRASTTFEQSTQLLQNVGQAVALFFIAVAPWLVVLLIVAGPIWLISRLMRGKPPIVGVVAPSDPPAPPPAHA